MRGEKGKLIINGTPTQTPTSPAKTLIQSIKLNPNDKITISANNTVGIGTSANYVSLRFSGTINGVFNNNIFEVVCTTANAKKTFTVTQPTIITNILVRGNANITFNNFTLKPQLELASTATTYEPHQGKELPLDLGSIELCKIEDYQDYFYKSGSKWYLHKEIEKIIFNGSENWESSQTNQSNKYRARIDFANITSNNYLKPSKNGEIGALLSNYYSTVPAGGAGTYGAYQGISIETATNLHIYDENYNTNNISLFKTWLASNNVTVYYVLATPTDTEITGTLKEQLETIYNAPLYEQTNITQTNNDLPMVLDITACKDNINGIKAFIRK